MLDPKLLRDHLEETAKRLATRGYVLDVTGLQDLEARRKIIQAETQELQSQRNQLAKQTGQRKAKGESIDDLLATADSNNKKLATKEAELEQLQQQLQERAL